MSHETKPMVTVPCGACRKCCQQNEYVELTANYDPSQYLTEFVRFVDPDSLGTPFQVLQRKPNGDCVYLDRATGCTIHDHAPQVCRMFDCRLNYLKWMEQSPTWRRQQEKAIPGKRDAMRHARSVLANHPLTEAITRSD